MQSKYDSQKQLKFNENEWVVSLINTGKGIKGVFGGHAKIVVEGLIKTDKPGMYDKELFIGEYHIMEAERAAEESWIQIPQALRNTKCKYMVLIKEEDKYNLSEQKYAEIQSRSQGNMKPADVMKMINNIKAEHQKIYSGEVKPDFQYAGKWCIYSYEGGHNCTTWAEEKLDIIGLGKHLVIDSTKAMPFAHVNSNPSICQLL